MTSTSKLRQSLEAVEQHLKEAQDYSEGRNALFQAETNAHEQTLQKLMEKESRIETLTAELERLRPTRSFAGSFSVEPILHENKPKNKA